MVPNGATSWQSAAMGVQMGHTERYFHPTPLALRSVFYQQRKDSSQNMYDHDQMKNKNHAKCILNIWGVVCITAYAVIPKKKI